MTKRRTGITKYFSNIVDETRDFLDEMVDRARDVEHDVRDSVSRAVANDEPDEKDESGTNTPGEPVPGTTGLATAVEVTSLASKVDELAEQVASLMEKVDKLARADKAATDDVR